MARPTGEDVRKALWNHVKKCYSGGEAECYRATTDADGCHGVGEWFGHIDITARHENEAWLLFVEHALPGVFIDMALDLADSPAEDWADMDPFFKHVRLQRSLTLGVGVDIEKVKPFVHLEREVTAAEERGAGQPSEQPQASVIDLEPSVPFRFPELTERWRQRIAKGPSGRDLSDMPERINAALAKDEDFRDDMLAIANILSENASWLDQNPKTDRKWRQGIVDKIGRAHV